MDLSNFLYLRQEGSLVMVFILLLIYDIFGGIRSRKWFRPVACILFALHMAAGFLPQAEGTAFGGMFVSSPMTNLMKNILNIATLFVLMQSGQWLKSGETVVREGEFYIVTMMTLLGMYFMISATNFMLLYIGIETASIPLACLAAYDKYKRESAEAGAKYIIMSAFSSGIMMFGLSFLYGALGSMYFADLNQAMVVDPMTIIGFVFFFAGLAFKISIVPFHLWTADVYQGAPTGVTAYLSVVSKAAASFALIFALYRVFGAMEQVWYYILWALAVLTIVVGNLFAIRQKDIKRFFAFSSISQAGYLLIGIIAGTSQGMTAMVYYILVYLFSNLAAFGVITAVENSTGRTDIAGYNGLRKTNPALAFIMMLAVFSLAGIPPFGGFFSKFFIFAAAADQGEYLLVFIALVNTVVSLYYYLLIIKAMFINQTEAEHGVIRADGYNRLSMVLCSGAIIAVGFISGIYQYIDNISFGI